MRASLFFVAGLLLAQHSPEYNHVLKAIESGKLSAARTRLEQLLAAQDRAEWRNLLGTLEEREGNLQAAARQYARAAEMEPAEEYLFDWANIFLANGAYSEALTGFRYAVEKHPESARLRVGLGIALYSTRDYDAAATTLCEAVDLDPSDARPLTFLGKMLNISPAMADAVRLRLKGFATRYPANAAAQYYYALSLWQRGIRAEETAEVEQFLRKALKLDPKFADAHLQLGILLEDNGRNAIPSYEAALRSNPRLAQAHYRLARLYRKAGETALADRHLAAYRNLQTRK